MDEHDSNSTNTVEKIKEFFKRLEWLPIGSLLTLTTLGGVCYTVGSSFKENETNIKILEITRNFYKTNDSLKLKIEECNAKLPSLNKN